MGDEGDDYEVVYYEDKGEVEPWMACLLSVTTQPGVHAFSLEDYARGETRELAGLHLLDSLEQRFKKLLCDSHQPDREGSGCGGLPPVLTERSRKMRHVHNGNVCAGD